MKKSKIIFWTATIIIALWEAAMPMATWILAPEYMTFGTKALGYPDYFAYSLAVAKVLGVIAITYAKTLGTIKEWAYSGLSFTLIFAFLSHLFVDRNIGYMLMPLAFLGILAVSYTYNKKIKQLKHTTSGQSLNG
ncbi:MAG: DoxX family protein [Bacteroidota bacterium]